MKGIFTRLAAVFLAAALVTPAAQAAGTEADPIQVGLAYGSGALVNANLENNTGYGAGYRLGYFDRDLDFVELGRTGSKETRITVVKAQNTWVNGSSYANSDNGGAVIGSYHLQVETCASYEEAARAAEDYRDGFPAWIDGEYQVRSGAYATREEAEDAQSRLGGGTIVGTSSYGVNVTRTGTDEILFQFDGGDGLALGVLPDVTGEDEVRTWFKGNRYYGGFRYERIGGGDLTVVNIVDLETYLKGVIPYEMSNSWPLEALKVQAVCARSYAYNNLRSSRHTPITSMCATPPTVRSTTGPVPTMPAIRPMTAPTGRWKRRRGSTPGMTDRSSRRSTPPATAEPVRASTMFGAPPWRTTPT